MARVRGVPVDVPACVTQGVRRGRGVHEARFYRRGAPAANSYVNARRGASGELAVHFLFLRVLHFFPQLLTSAAFRPPHTIPQRVAPSRHSSMHRIALRTPALFPKPVVKNTLRIPIYQLDAFASAPFKGNPAAVCPLDA